MRKLSIIIPAYNEEKTIASVLDALATLRLAGWEREIIVVDDGSRDATAEIIRGYGDIRAFFHTANRGKGAAIRTGLAEAVGDAVIIQDADLEYDPADIPRLLAAFADTGADAVYGSRNLVPDRHGYPHYVLGVAVLTGFINLLFRSRLTDAYTGYKLFRTPVFRELGIASAGFEFEAEATCRLLQRGHRICEIPIQYRPRSFSEGKKIRFRDGVIGLRTIMKIWWGESVGVIPAEAGIQRQSQQTGFPIKSGMTNEINQRKKVMVFGVFDGLHPGHRYFLASAREHGNELIAVVARDEVVRALKRKTPRQSEEERRRAVARLTAVSRAVLGDRESGIYNIIKEHQPDIICLGYDQHALGEDLKDKIRAGAIPLIQIRRLIARKKDQ